MSLNQIIDQNPGSALVVNNTLKLKCDQLRVKETIKADTVTADHFVLNPTSNDVLDLAYTIVLLDSSAIERAVVGTDTTGIIRFRRIGSTCGVQFPDFNVASAATTGSGTFRVKFASTLPEKFRPVGGNYSTPIKVKSNNTDLTTPGIATYDSVDNGFFSLSSNYVGTTAFTTGVTGSSTIAAGMTADFNIVWFCA